MKKFVKYSVLYFLIIYSVTVFIPFSIIKLSAEETVTVHEPIVPVVQTSSIEIEDEFVLYDVATDEIITVSNENFLIGSLISEMSSSVPIEALKAQVVASNSYYSCIRQQNSNNEYHISYNSELGTVYVDPSTIDEETLSIFQQAVESVYGEILTYDNAIAYCSFFDSSNGNTESAIDLWGEDLPYLESVASPYDTISAGVKKTYYYSSEEVESRMTSNWKNAVFDFDLDYELWFSDIKYTVGETVISINVCGYSITGEELRQCFSLSSPSFEVEYNGEYFVFTSYGQGSLVGMSQIGAVYMASEGADYTEILSWYYKDTVLYNVLSDE